jgi:hypothetical protein
MQTAVIGVGAGESVAEKPQKDKGYCGNCERRRLTNEKDQGGHIIKNQNKSEP